MSACRVPRAACRGPCDAHSHSRVTRAGHGVQPFLYVVTSLLMFKEHPQHRQVQVLSLECKGELARLRLGVAQAPQRQLDALAAVRGEGVLLQRLLGRHKNPQQRRHAQTETSNQRLVTQVQTRIGMRHGFCVFKRPAGRCNRQNIFKTGKTSTGYQSLGKTSTPARQRSTERPHLWRSTDRLRCRDQHMD